MSRPSLTLILLLAAAPGLAHGTPGAALAPSRQTTTRVPAQSRPPTAPRPVLQAGERSASPAAGQDIDLIRNPLFGTVSFMSGRFTIDAGSREPVERARAFLRRNREVLELNDPDQELGLLTAQGPDRLGMSHVRFVQRARGLPVFNAELMVHLKEGVVTSINGTYLPSVALPAEARVEGDEAVDIAREDLERLLDLGLADGEVAGRDLGLEQIDGPVLGFFNDGLLSGQRTPTELAWYMSINGYLYAVSALDGRVIDAWDAIPAALSRKVYTASNTTNVPGTLVCDETKGCTSSNTDIKNAWKQLSNFYSYFLSTFNRDSFDGKGAVLSGTTHYGANFMNAYWDGAQMIYGNGYTVNDITAHELSHAVCQYSANLVYHSQSGSLNESLSDCYAAMIDRDDWTIGEESPGGTMRSLSDPTKYSQPRTMAGYKNTTSDNGGVHVNSGIPNWACFLGSDGGSFPEGQVTGAGRAATEQIWYRTETTKLTSSSQFSDFAKLLEESCKELYGVSSSQCVATQCAMHVTGMETYSLFYPPGSSSASSSCTGSCNTDGPTCGDLSDAYTTDAVNIGYYPFKVRSGVTTSLVSCDDPKFPALQTLTAGQGFAVQSTRNPCCLNNAPMRPALNGYVFGYVRNGGQSGWIPASALEFTGYKSSTSCATGPADEDFQVAHNPYDCCRQMPCMLDGNTKPHTMSCENHGDGSSECGGDRTDVTKKVNADTLYLRYAPLSTAIRYLHRDDVVHQMYDNHQGWVFVEVTSSHCPGLTPNGVRGWTMSDYLK